jgi:hypothetical protein
MCVRARKSSIIIYYYYYYYYSVFPKERIRDQMVADRRIGTIVASGARSGRGRSGDGGDGGTTPTVPRSLTV